jgi:ketosteroid isomerase-like protein
MSRHTFASLAVMISVALSLAAGRAAMSRAVDDPAKEIAVKVTTAGAAMFNARDAKGLALTYTDDARLEIYSRDNATGSLKTETRVGRADIESYYASLFKSDDVPHARNTVEHARLIEPDLLTIIGVFEPNTEAAEPLKLPFVQVRARQGDSWKIVNLQIFILPQK